MTFSGHRDCVTSTIAPEHRHREAAICFEMAAIHHHHAALLHASGNTDQADKQGELARKQAAKALESSARALNVRFGC